MDVVREDTEVVGVKEEDRKGWRWLKSIKKNLNLSLKKIPANEMNVFKYQCTVKSPYM